MKKLQFAFILSLLTVFSVQSQDDAEIEAEIQNNSPFSEARYNFFKKTVIVFNEYLDTDSGSFNTLDLRILLPIGNKAWQLRADIPLISTNTGTDITTGFGDLSFAASYIPYLNKKRGIALRGRVYTNSAQNPSFGTGKWVFAPAFFYGEFFGKNKKFLWISNVEYQISFAGDSDRSNISNAILDNSIIYNFKKNWVAADVTFRYNAIVEGYNNSVYVEFGRKFTPDAMFYIHPSMGFGDAKSYNTGLELGLLIYY